MSEHDNVILRELAACEEETPYTYAVPTDDNSDVADIVRVHVHDDVEIIVVSDLHLASGLGNDGNYSGTENFFGDHAFGRFLEHVHHDLVDRGRRGMLVINGDFVDLLRVKRTPSPKPSTDPASTPDYEPWKAMLDSVGVLDLATDKPFSTTDLRLSVTSREEKYGLKTNDYKSVWKLDSVVSGHPVFFASLAAWLREGHSLVIVKGNHDLEWLWQPVRHYLRLALARMIDGDAPGNALASMRGRVRFVDDAMLVNDHLYFEHGHRFDRWTRVLGPPLLGKLRNRELNIPIGSFMNRYILNRLEETYPFIDNVRPQQNILPMVMREHLPMGLRILFVSIPVAFGLIRKRYYRYLFHRVIPFALGVAPLAALAFVYARALQNAFSGIAQTVAGIPLFNEIAATVLAPVAGYFWMKFIAWFQLGEPSSLIEPASGRADQHREYRCIVMGHTHDPEQVTINTASGEVRFFNTGTWIPVLETSTADIREDRTFAFLRLIPSRLPAGSVRFEANRLQRWNDDAGRCDDMTLVTRKGSEG